MKRSPSSSQRLFSRPWRTVLALIAIVGIDIIGGAQEGSSTQALAAGSLPCDIYAPHGTPCVAVHSMARALYSAYNQMTPLSSGGNSSPKDSLQNRCNATTGHRQTILFRDYETG